MQDIEGLADGWWAAPLLWAALYTADYALTLRGARLYATHARRHFDVGKDYEMTPAYQGDIRALRPFSPTFMIWLVGVTIGLAGLQRVSQSMRVLDAYLFIVGMLILVEVPVLLRHARNIASFSIMARSNAVTGRVQYQRWATHYVSAVDFAAFATLFAVVSAPMHSWFVLGGAVRCALSSTRHFRQGRALRAGRPEQAP